jgi:regulatory protein
LDLAGTITALQAQKRNHQRVNVYLDGEFAFGLARIVAAWLHVGQALSDDKIVSLQAEDARETAYQRALSFISYRERSQVEVEQNLRKNHVPEELIGEVVARLQRSHLLDDRRFAQNWAENRSEFRPRSRRALTYELRQRGLPGEVIEETLAQVDDESLAVQAALKKARRLTGLEWPEFRQKLYAFLARRGFSYEISATAASQVWTTLHDNTQAGNPLEEEEVEE